MLTLEPWQFECPALLPGAKIVAHAADMNYVGVCSPTLGVCVDVHGPQCHQKPHECLVSVPQLVAMLVSKSHTSTKAMLIWVACAATQGYDVVHRKATD